MSQIAGLSDLRGQGAPADIGNYQFAATAMVFKFTFSGVTYTVAMASGVSGWVLLAQSAAGADNVEINAALTYVDGLGGGEVYLGNGIFDMQGGLSFTSRTNILFTGSGAQTILRQGDGAEIGAVFSLWNIVGSGEANVTISNITIDGNQANNPITTTSGVDLAHAGAAIDIENVNIVDVVFKNMRGYAINFEECYGGTIVGCRFVDNLSYSMRLLHNTHLRVFNNEVYSSGLIEITACGSSIFAENNLHPLDNSSGFYIRTTTNRSVFANNTIIGTNCISNGGKAFAGGGEEYNVFIGNTIKGFDIGVYASHGIYHVIANNTIEESVRQAINIEGSNGVIVISNQLSGSVQYGINADGATGEQKTIIAENNIFNNGYHGILVNTPNSIIAFNTIYNNSQDAANTYHGISGGVSNCLVIGNLCYDDQGGGATQSDGIRWGGGSDTIIILNRCWGNLNYGINISAGAATRTRVKDNVLLGNAAGAFNDLGTDTILASVSGDFIQYGGGSGGWTAAVINTSPGGIDIDADNEFAYSHKQLPLEVQQVVRIKIWAYSNVIEATNNMLLRIVAHGAASSELWSGNPIDVVNKPSVEEGGIVQYDVIHWVITVADDAQIGTLLGGDYVELMAVGEAAAAPDIATDALFGGYEIEYV